MIDDSPIGSDYNHMIKKIRIQVIKISKYKF